MGSACRNPANSETLQPLAEREIHNKLAVLHDSSCCRIRVVPAGPLHWLGSSTWQGPRFSFTGLSASRWAIEEPRVFEEEASP